MRILVATDAAPPQVNGVVRWIESIAAVASRHGAEIELLSPNGFTTVPMPTYPEIRLALIGPNAVLKRIASQARAGRPIDHIHIATEGPIGFATRRFCVRRRIPFTTSYTTRFPEYISSRWPIPSSFAYAVLRRFHNAGNGVMVATPSLARELDARGFRRTMHWSRGVDDRLFNPRKRKNWNLPRPIFLFAGRLAPEKNLECFLSLDLPGSKVVAGGGPIAANLRRAFPAAHFLGVLQGEDLACAYASADVFVFPSLTDTFGNVLLEAMASGLPIAAFPVAAPSDVVGTSGAGVLDHDLGAACRQALCISRDIPHAHAQKFTWDKTTQEFLSNIVAARAQHQHDASTNLSPRRLSQLFL